MKRSWWKESVVYQIYPRSFRDSNGDGIGDLCGIIQKLDYLNELGVDVIWLSPIYKSPNDDNGYDISDYHDIMDEFGTMADFDELLARVHDRDMRLLMDLVVNHTSDEHAWFRESRKSKDNPYRDWYIWRPGREGREPNNWSAAFGGSAWAYDEATDEYYLHLFSKKQPDLNWENPEVRNAIYEMMAWWLDKGVDGFRMDVINMISKARGLPDAPVVADGPYQFPGHHVFHGPRLLEFLEEMKQRVLSRYDAFTVGETPLATPEQAVGMTDEHSGALNMLLHFEHMDLDTAGTHMLGKWNLKPLDLLELKRVTTRWQKALEQKGWNGLYLSNHDQPRALSRFGDDGRYRLESAKLLATFLHTLQGTPYIYQGEEIGMTNVRFPTIDDYRDIETLNFYREAVEGKGLDPVETLTAIQAKSRDNGRTPMHWDDSPNAGFTSAVPWIGVNPNYPEINVDQARRDPDSVFHYYRKLIELRRAHPIMVYGAYDLLLEAHRQIYAYTRTLDKQRLLVMLNFSADTPAFALPSSIHFAAKDLLIGNYEVNPTQDIRLLTLRPYEARVYRLR